MDRLRVSPSDAVFVEALRELIRTGVSAAPTLEHSPLLDMEIVVRESGPDATPDKRAHVFIEILRRIIRRRLEGKESETAAILFGLEDYAGMPVRDRYRTVAKLYNPYWAWENYRKEPLTRHLLAVYLALRRETVFASRKQPSISLPQESLYSPSVAAHSPRLPRHADKVLIIQNISREGPGLFRRLLDEVAVDYEVVDLSKGEPFPDPTNYAALIVLGGPDSANDQTEKISAELGRVRQALDAGVPYLGVCLGLQLAVKATGGNVVESVKEVGLSTPYSVTLTELALTALGKKDPLFVGLRNDFRVFQLHGETVEITSNMQLLAVGKHCRNQIVKIRRGAYGIQSHFELSREMLAEWLRADPDLTPLDEQKVMAEFDAIEEVYTITGLSLLRNFLHIAGVIG